AIWIGYRLCGNSGAIASFLGIIVLPGMLMVLVGTLFASLQGFDITHIALDGAAAAAVGLSLSLGLTAARRVPRKVIPMAIMAATFVAIGFLDWALGWGVLGLVFVCILLGGLATGLGRAQCRDSTDPAGCVRTVIAVDDRWRPECRR